MTSPPSPNDPAAIHHRIAQARARVLGGRGPDAEPGEIRRSQRDRPTLGAQPAARERQTVTDQTTLARQDPDALTHLVARRHARLAGSLTALASTLSATWRDRRGRAGLAARSVALAAAGGAITALAAEAALRRVIYRRKS